MLAIGILAAVASGEEQVIAKLGPLAGVGGWAGLVGIVVQVTAAGGMGVFGVALSWMFGLASSPTARWACSSPCPCRARRSPSAS